MEAGLFKYSLVAEVVFSLEKENKGLMLDIKMVKGTRPNRRMK